jgi:SSS family solute:Na+ symporter|tara:strand:- start:5494 stop:7212 length:1719 start_codon:yes stop_codon:yes gene_type:complete
VELIDWMIVGGFMMLTLCVGLWTSRKAAVDSSSYFLGSRNMPWWLLGMSMVATTFSTDTPNLVTNIVRTNGVAGNWSWWCFLLTGMVTTFVYARLWRRLGVTTDIEFYEKRYAGKAASFLRCFRGIYLGIFFNVMIMGGVTLAAIKIGGVIFGVSPVAVVLIAGLVTVVFSTAGGFLGVLITDMILFFTAMVGAVLVAWFALDHPAVGGLNGLLDNPVVASKASIFPSFSDPSSYIPLLIIPLTMQWWSAWYPGSEPGGGGYAAQRMLAAKNEKHAIGASAFFNFAHYALRPWPWIIVALASLVVFPDIESLHRALPHVEPSIIGHDIAYAAMLTLLPTGILGLVVASLVCAYISTISTHLNWGASYIVNDLYVRFLKPDASAKNQVLVGRIATVSLMIFACIVALLLEDALQIFRLLLTVGAGTGLLFLLRWFWMRISVWSEISAMIVSFLVAIFMEVIDPEMIQGWERFVVSVAITTVSWIFVTLLVPPASQGAVDQLKRELTGSEGLARVIRLDLLLALLSSLAIYGMLFSIGSIIYSDLIDFMVWLGIAIVSGLTALFLWKYRINKFS